MSALRLNLLPHREQRRARLRRQFWVFIAGAMAAGGAAGVLVHGVLLTRIEGQVARNQFLKGEISRVDKQIEAVKRLREDIEALLARKKIIESLQADRGQTVVLLDELARQVPDGIYLRSVREESRRVTLVGLAQSNARVSTLMRNLEGTSVFENAVLQEVSTTTVGNRRLAEFSLVVTMRRGAGAAQAAPATAASPGN
jgi:type IV pilus assembly protein PilN